MGSVVRYRAFHPSVEQVPFAAHGTTVKQPDILRSIAVEMERYRARQLDGEIADILARSGGRFTDSMEREIDRRITSGAHESR